MELLNVSEHLNCYMYDNRNASLISLLEKKKGEAFEYMPAENQIIALLKGKIVFSYGYHVDDECEAGYLTLLSNRHQYAVIVQEDCLILRINLHRKINFCHHFPLEMLFELSKKTLDPQQGHSLKTNKKVTDYLNRVVQTLNEGLKCAHLHNLQQQELLFYLRAFYPKNELAAFFAPILNDDIQFVKMIYENYEQAEDTETLAKLTHYSVSGFKKRFVKVFGMLPYAWLEKEKAKKIHYDINCTQTSFKEITVKYNFSSPSHFNQFCKKMYGQTPTMLRQNAKQRFLFDES